MSPNSDSHAPRRASSARQLWLHLRRAVFWTHLVAGCAAGVVILLLGATGVVLTYERQILGAAEAASWPDPPAGAERRSLDALLADARSATFEPQRVAVRREPAAPVEISAGRRQRIAVDPWTGAEVAEAAPRLHAFFSFVTGLHRWIALEGDARRVARQITGVANIVFLFILVTGFVIWLPPLWKRALLARQLLFARSYPTAKARDWAWHHVIGIWCLVPLILIAATGTVFHYDWARDTLRWLSGAQAPAPESSATDDPAPAATALRDALPLETLLQRAAAEAGDWRRITVTLPAPGATQLEVTIDSGNGAQIQHQDVMILDRRTGVVESLAPRNGDDAYAWARSVNRFLHTGELFGFGGQTVAGLASLGCVFLVWTGLSLAWRRLVQAPLRRRRVARTRGTALALEARTAEG
ncbi:MAG: PepSY-associated TM helix domain-containing protein [Pseudomonadales bacterium]|jgi:uncharacterized iron-regulated membrane protein|nr:PepSY-associated TM helix domain-containing protein [Pseudomonadales bacterium]